MKHLLGMVKSDKNTKTAIVDVTSFKVHPKYLKRIKVNKSFAVQNDMDAKVGNRVRIEETRPISKTKHWKITKII
ncbi:MAG: 30S ribosomal protein S17 [Candidatus Collierbacteria bacterium GW2011_GWC2_44_18]|uniref:30S ribosomal protein S17 n=1 Tax=Candidatus Collierbacteria bacterium GW2011_GWC2_44_18 TaxID=1618392 RepID=A0A0G1K0W9_9BACT|nr:MAG: 30S ribosomal protein S17 [Microgenomates group bacterium GW2011_GWC1_44_10]KKT49787.1 MAG: 30S ribosomal protein S17 [Candidatus Collierbacteria bacterium GW2011_GWC2_44_18]